MMRRIELFFSAPYLLRTSPYLSFFFPYTPPGPRPDLPLLDLQFLDGAYRLDPATFLLGKLLITGGLFRVPRRWIGRRIDLGRSDGMRFPPRVACLCDEQFSPLTNSGCFASAVLPNLQLTDIEVSSIYLPLTCAEGVSRRFFFLL